MVKVAGRAIVDTLLDALRPLGIEEIVVVTGFQADALEQYLRAQKGFRWRFIHNERYASTNNILSLQVARNAIKAPFVLVESDIYVRPELLTDLSVPDRMLVAPYMPTMDGTGIILDAKGFADEMIIRAHLARPDFLEKMYKTVNFYSFSEATWKTYGEALDRWVREGRLDQYYEAVLADLIKRGEVLIQGVNVGIEGWAEIDDIQDLAALEFRLQREGSSFFVTEPAGCSWDTSPQTGKGELLGGP
jgi:choline kinase